MFLWWYFVCARALQISETGLTHHPLFGCWWIAYLGHVSLMNCLNWLKPWWIASDASSKSLWLSEASTSVGDKSCMHELFSLGYVSIRKNMTFLWWEHHPTHRFDDYYIETLRFRTTRWSCTCFKFLRSLNSEHPCHNFEQIIAKQLWNCTKSPHHVHKCPVVSILVRNIKLQCQLNMWMVSLCYCVNLY